MSGCLRVRSRRSQTGLTSGFPEDVTFKMMLTFGPSVNLARPYFQNIQNLVVSPYQHYHHLLQVTIISCMDYGKSLLTILTCHFPTYNLFQPSSLNDPGETCNQLMTLLSSKPSDDSCFIQSRARVFMKSVRPPAQATWSCYLSG